MFLNLVEVLDASCLVDDDVRALGLRTPTPQLACFVQCPDLTSIVGDTTHELSAYYGEIMTLIIRTAMENNASIITMPIFPTVTLAGIWTQDIAALMVHGLYAAFPAVR